MNKDLLEVALKIFSKEKIIQRIISIDSNPVVEKGENFASDLQRISMLVILGNGREVKKSYIQKRIDTNNGESWLKGIPFYQNERKMYTHVLDEMGYLMEEIDDNDEHVWCDIVWHHNKTNTLLLEDLAATGYKTVPRQDGHDLEHGILAVRGLGKFHGLAMVLESRGIIDKKDYTTNYFFGDEVGVKCFVFEGIMTSLEGINEFWGEEWKLITKKLEVTFDDFYKRHKQMMDSLDPNFTVLNHGDCWANNTMFKYDWQNRSIFMKFIDFQSPYFDHPCVDLTTYIYLSIQPSIRRNNLDTFINHYHKSLIKTLNQYCYTGKKPTLREIKDTMDKLMFLGFSLFLNNHAFLSCKSSGGLDVNLIYKTQGTQGYNKQVFKEKGLEERLKPDILEYLRKFYPIWNE